MGRWWGYIWDPYHWGPNIPAAIMYGVGAYFFARWVKRTFSRHPIHEQIAELHRKLDALVGDDPVEDVPLDHGTTDQSESL